MPGVWLPLSVARRFRPTALPEGLELLNDEPTPTPRPQPKPEPDFRPAPRTVPKPKPAALDDPYDVPEAIPWTVRQNEPKAASASNWALYAGIAGAAVVGLLVIALIYEATRDRLGRQAVAEAKAAGEAGFVAEARVAAARRSGRTAAIGRSRPPRSSTRATPPSL